MAGEVAQGVSHEFRSQYCQKKKNQKDKNTYFLL
jgi:hypothetical protein